MDLFQNYAPFFEFGTYFTCFYGNFTAVTKASRFLYETISLILRLKMTKNNTARLAGFIYFLVVIMGIYNLAYVPSQLIVSDDPAATISNIQSSELMFRSGIVTGVLSYVFFLVLPFVLFDLFKEVNRNMAVLMVILAATSVPISLVNLIEMANVLTLVSSETYINALTTEQLHTQVTLLFKSYNNGIKIVQVFWGLWLFPFGYLVFKSGFLPKVLGILLMLGCFGYFTFFLGNLLFPEVTIPSIIRRPATLGEIGTCLWLLIMGTREKPAK